MDKGGSIQRKRRLQLQLHNSCFRPELECLIEEINLLIYGWNHVILLNDFGADIKQLMHPPGTGDTTHLVRDRAMSDEALSASLFTVDSLDRWNTAKLH